MDILTRIVGDRRQRIENEGHCFGVTVPAERKVPLAPFAAAPGIICEVKRKSPSKGDIARGLDAVEQATLYRDAGVTSISVLTEEQYFGGSLQDLIDVKERFPEAAVLRKDFLVDTEDIDISFRAGADAVLIIAAMLEKKVIADLYHAAAKRGMAALVEIHDQADAEKVRSLSPQFTGINSRNLKTFVVDPVIPLRVKQCVDWETRLVFESGLKWMEDAMFARVNGFSAILVGEAAVRDPSIIPGLINGMRAHEPKKTRDFWYRLYERQRPDEPLVKVCGITNVDDAQASVDAGADVLGFVLADSPRKASESDVRACAELPVLKVGVVVGAGGASALQDEAARLLREGILDAIQLHGDESADACAGIAFPYYKAVRLGSVDDVQTMGAFRCPRVLVDAFSKEARGGTGRQIDGDILESISDGKPLWIAGGIGSANVRDIVLRWRPELVDASSKLETLPGKKDHRLISQYVGNAKSARK